MSTHSHEERKAKKDLGYLTQAFTIVTIAPSLRQCEPVGLPIVYFREHIGNLNPQICQRDAMPVKVVIGGAGQVECLIRIGNDSDHRSEFNVCCHVHFSLLSLSSHLLGFNMWPSNDLNGPHYSTALRKALQDMPRWLHFIGKMGAKMVFSACWGGRCEKIGLLPVVWRQ